MNCLPTAHRLLDGSTWINSKLQRILCSNRTAPEMRAQSESPGHVFPALTSRMHNQQSLQTTSLIRSRLDNCLPKLAKRSELASIATTWKDHVALIGRQQRVKCFQQHTGAHNATNSGTELPAFQHPQPQSACSTARAFHWTIDVFNWQRPACCLAARKRPY